MKNRAIPDIGSICRDLQHAWVPKNAGKLVNLKGKHTGWWRALTCSRCETDRIDELTKVGDVVKRTYAYPEGYRLEGGGKLTADERANLRLQNLKE